MVVGLQNRRVTARLIQPFPVNMGVVVVVVGVVMVLLLFKNTLIFRPLQPNTQQY